MVRTLLSDSWPDLTKSSYEEALRPLDRFEQVHLVYLSRHSNVRRGYATC